MVKTGIGILTFNHIATGRQEDFWRTYRSVERENPDELVVLTNGSTDGTQDVVTELGGIVDDSDSRIFYGNTILIEELTRRGCETIILSADDLEYTPGWLSRIENFIEAAPADIALVSCYMEPVWGWNQPRETITYGGELALVRDSVCGSSWVFRTADWSWMGPFPETMPGEDLAICQRVAQRGKRMAALDLAEHIGQERSAWGNQSHLSAEPLDREKWGLNAQHK